MRPPHSDRSDSALTPLMASALRAMPVRLTASGHLPAAGPHAGTLRALKDRGLIRPGARQWVITARGATELAYIERCD